MGGSTKPVVGVHLRENLYAEHLTALSSHAKMLDIACWELNTSLGAILSSLDEADEESFTALRHIRAGHSTTPIMVLARSLETNHALELLKLGVADCMCLPAPPETLWRKVERAILHSGGPTLDSPLLSLLWDATVYPAHEEKRRCFRSDTAADYPAYVSAVRPRSFPKCW